MDVARTARDVSEAVTEPAPARFSRHAATPLERETRHALGTQEGNWVREAPEDEIEEEDFAFEFLTSGNSNESLSGTPKDKGDVEQHEQHRELRAPISSKKPKGAEKRGAATSSLITRLEELHRQAAPGDGPPPSGEGVLLISDIEMIQRGFPGASLVSGVRQFTARPEIHSTCVVCGAAVVPGPASIAHGWATICRRCSKPDGD